MFLKYEFQIKTIFEDSDSCLETSSYTSDECMVRDVETFPLDTSATPQRDLTNEYHLIFGSPDIPFTPTPPDSKPARKSTKLSLKKVCQVPFSSPLGMFLLRTEKLDENHHLKKLVETEKWCKIQKECKINRRSKLLLKKMKQCKIMLDK